LFVERRFYGFMTECGYCRTPLESSTVSATFLDQSGVTSNRSFTFTSTNITQVLCNVSDGECQVSIFGMGLVSGEKVPRKFVFVFRAVHSL
jgi:hypothetical protein